jgi:hypothetical protein
LNPSDPIFETDSEIDYQSIDPASIGMIFIFLLLAMMGDSCGGNLVMSLMSLMRKDLGSLAISDPECLVLLSPWVFHLSDTLA